MNKQRIAALIQFAIPDNNLGYKAYSWFRIKQIQNRLVGTTNNEFTFDEKKQIVKAYSHKHKKEFRKLSKIITDILSNSSTERDYNTIDEYWYDIAFYNIVYGFLPEEYICYEFDHKNKEERLQFISDSERSILIHRVNNVKGIRVFDNKALTFQKYKEYYGRDCIYIKDKADFNNFRQFISNHYAFVQKNVYEAKGSGVRLVFSEKIDENYFETLLRSGPYLLEEVVHQSSIMSSFNASSVNTIRVITFKVNNEIIIPYTFMKAGRHGSFVDNGGAGGLLIGVNAQTGIIDADGISELNEKFPVHPDSKVRFKGSQLPDWEGLMSLSKKVSAMEENLGIIGWDFAHTDKGWVIIEGNAGTQFIGPQSVYKIGLRSEIHDYLSKMQLII